MKFQKILAPLAIAMLLASCGGQPAASSEAPAGTSEAPAASSEAPAGTSEAPAASSEAPAASSEAPAASSEAPAEQSLEPESQEEPQTSTEPLDSESEEPESLEPESEEPESLEPESEEPESLEPVSEEPESSTEPLDPEDYYVKEDTTIYLSTTFRQEYQEAIDAIIEDFKEIEPKVTVVNVKETGNYDDLKNKVVNQYATREHPDMFAAYPDSVQDILDYGFGLDMTEEMNNPVYGWDDDDLYDISEGYLAEGSSYSIPGYYSLPLCKSTECMYYNMNIIGVNLAEIDPEVNNGKAISEEYLNDLTWEELLGHLLPALDAYDKALPADQKLRNGPGMENDNEHPYRVLGYDSDDNLFITLAEQYGYAYTSVDEYGEASLDFVNDGMKNLMKTLNKAYDDGLIMTQGTFGGFTSKASVAANILISIGSTAGASNQYSEDFDVGVARIPRAAGRDRKVINQGPSLAFLKHEDAAGNIDTNRRLACWRFYDYFSQKENNAYWAQTTSYLPIRYSVAEDPDYIEWADPESKTGKAIVQAKVATYGANEIGPDLFTSPVFHGSGVVRKQVGALLTNCLLDKDIDNNIDGLFDTALNEAKKAL